MGLRAQPECAELACTPPGPPHCTYGLRVRASRVLHSAPEAQGGLQPPGGTQRRTRHACQPRAWRTHPRAAWGHSWWRSPVRVFTPGGVWVHASDWSDDLPALSMAKVRGRVRVRVGLGSGLGSGLGLGLGLGLRSRGAASLRRCQSCRRKSTVWRRTGSGRSSEAAGGGAPASGRLNRFTWFGFRVRVRVNGSDLG